MTSLDAELRRLLSDALRDCLPELLRAAVRDELAELARESRARASVDQDGFMTVKAAADHARVRRETIRAWIDKGRLSRRYAGNRLRVLRSELDALMALKPLSAEKPDSQSPAAIAAKVLGNPGKGRPPTR